MKHNIIAKDSDRILVFDHNVKKGIPSKMIKALSIGFLIAFTLFCLAAPMLHNLFDWLDDKGNTIAMTVILIVVIYYCVKWVIRKVNK